MLQGLMPALPLNPECIVEHENGTTAINLADMHTLYKVPLGPHWQHQEALTCYRQALVVHGSDTRINARQFCDTIRGVFAIPPTVLPSPCNELPPDLPNGFSDGGVINPVYSEFQFGGAGMWWPERDILADPLHQNELDIDHEITPDGIAVWGAIPGQRCDSTRAEIIAATAMLAAPIPCHVGIDNLNTVCFATC